MDENAELLEYMYQDSEMATFTLTELLKDLEGKDNKIKPTIEEILKEYEEYLKKTKCTLKKHNVDLKPKGTMAKMGAGMGIKKEVKADNSDASIADMLIKGVSMGSIDMEKKIKTYEKTADKKELELAHDFLKFQQKAIEQLKAYL